MIYALGEISGAHFNPAVSLGFVLSGRLKLKTALAYAGVQLLGAAAAGLLLAALFPASKYLGGTQPAGLLLQSLTMGGPVSGASMNPARSFGPALALLNFSNFWI